LFNFETAFITDDGRVKLLDFGAARFNLGEQSKSFTFIAKGGYAPPEQYSRRSRLGPETDIYALAATLYRLVTGHTPPDAGDRMMGEPLVPPNELGANLTPHQEAALLTALSLRSEDRHATVRQFRAALEGTGPVAALGAGRDTSRRLAPTRELPGVTRPERSHRPHPTLFVVALGVGAVVLGIAGTGLLSTPTNTDPSTRAGERPSGGPARARTAQAEKARQNFRYLAEESLGEEIAKKFEQNLVAIKNNGMYEKIRDKWMK
jgi:serine/threonine protein kinase